jgi:hypothetical protein
MPLDREVAPSALGGWEVLAPEAGGRRSSRHATCEEAISRAKEIVINAGGGEIRIRARDGVVKTQHVGQTRWPSLEDRAV